MNLFSTLVVLVLVGTTVAFMPAPLTVPRKTQLQAFDPSVAAMPMPAFDTFPTLVAIGATTLAGTVTAMFRTSINKSKFLANKKQAVVVPEPEPIDVSIPYEATFELAYQAFNDNNAESFDQSHYEQFKQKYTAMVVAEVTAKKYMRDFARLESELALLKK